MAWTWEAPISMSLRNGLGRLITYVVWATATVAVADCQENLSLVTTDVVPVASDHGLNHLLPVKSGAEGQILIRFDVDTVTSIAADGKRVWDASLTQVPELTNAGLSDFAAGDGDEVYLLAERQEVPGDPSSSVTYIVRFRPSGDRSIVKLSDSRSGPFHGRQLAVFGSGDFFVSGFLQGASNATAFIFNNSGQVVKELTFANDVRLEEPNQRHPSLKDLSGQPTSEVEFRDRVEASWAQTSSDGNVYLARTDPKGPVFIVTPGGKVTRMALKPPAVESRLYSVLLDRGSVLSEYRLTQKDQAKPRKCSLRIMNLATEQIRGTAEYAVDVRNNAIGPVQYKDGLLTYIGLAKDNHLQIVKVRLQP